MIQHIVMWKFKEEAEGHTKQENLAWVKESLLALPPYIPEIKKIEVHTDDSGTGDNYDAVLVTVFESFDALNCYKTHPEHVKISSFVAKATEKRASVDYILNETRS